jgi:WD40 repeat protein/mono/diheme cytochrome c family protein
MRVSIARLAAIAAAFLTIAVRASGATNDYATVDAIFVKSCVECHASDEPEGNLVLETFDALMKGGETGSAIVPGKSSDSLLVKLIQGFEVDGKKKIMPPGKREKLKPEEIAVIRGWIDAGAKPPAQQLVKELKVPKIEPKTTPRRSIHSLAYEPKSRLIAVALPGEVELRSADSRTVVRTLKGHRGHVNALAFSKDGKHLFAAAGEPGLFGEVRQWSVNDGKLVRTFEGHADALYAVAISPDGETLATGSYDQKIRLWKVASGEELKTLTGHNGCVFDLAFRPDGKILASASADRTVKLWDVASGERRDTLSQSLKELHTVEFSPDGKRVAAAGVDNRIRVWEVSEKAAETTNPLLHAKFAHEGSILRVAFSRDGKTIASSAEDRTVKLFDASEVNERLALEIQPDWAAGLAFVADDKGLAVGRIDGTLEVYDTTSGKVMPPAKPDLTFLEPRGIQRGKEATIKLRGSNLLGATELNLHHSKLTGEMAKRDEWTATEGWITLTAAPDAARGSYELSVKTAGGESKRVKVYVDDLPQVTEADTNRNTLAELPVSAWGTLDKLGDIDEWEITGHQDETMVFDLAAKSLGSKANAVITLSDAEGKVLASNNDYDGVDPLIAFTLPADGNYRLRVTDLMLGASAEHFYRLTVGKIPLVTACYPTTAATNAETEVELVGFNLPAERKVKVKTDAAGEIEVPVDDKFRTRRALKIAVSDVPHLPEAEPNNAPDAATKVSNPGVVSGRIWSRDGDDTDLFSFEAQSGQKLVVKTAAAKRGSPVDTKIEILHPGGRPVERLLLQAVRNSAITFRNLTSTQIEARVENWEEMELNDLLYMQGEVVKLFRAPQGPDSGFVFYTTGVQRRTYFDTSPTAHALDEVCYIVQPHPPGTSLVPNGLPAFPLHYASDDDGERKLAADSRVYFTPPTNGTYLVRVADTRGFGGERFVYDLSIREAQPDFKATLEGANPTVPVGSGQSFTIKVERLDAFDGEVRVDITSLPDGFSASTPVIIEAGHSEAKGTLFANADAMKPAKTNAAASKLVASATINGKRVTKDVNNFGTIKLGEKPKLFVSMEEYREGETNRPTSSDPLVLTIAPGQIIPAWLRIERNGHDDLVTFQVDNLPHGIIVDNIGLSGVLIPKDQNERQIFLTAAKWVSETDRLCYAIENQAGKQTSRPVLLKVRKPGSKMTAQVK